MFLVFYLVNFLLYIVLVFMYFMSGGLGFVVWFIDIIFLGINFGLIYKVIGLKMFFWVFGVGFGIIFGVW